MVLPSIPIQQTIAQLKTIHCDNIEQRVLTLDITFGVSRLIESCDHIEHIIYLGDLLKMEEYVKTVFKDHKSISVIQQLYVEVHKYV